MTLKTHKFAKIAASGVAAAALLCGASAAQAQLKINLIDLGGVTGSQSELGFKIAAHYWESVLTNNVTVNLGVRYSALGAGIIGSTSSPKFGVSITDVEDAMASVGNSSLDAALVVPTITGSANISPFGTVGTIDMIRNGPQGVGKLSSTQIYDTNDTKDNATVSGTRANLMALGYALPSAATDASVTFSTAFSFDFNPLDGITAGQMDFIGVAIHEIGHALGFTSGVDTYDAYLPLGPNGAVTTINWDNNTVGNILDLFRYSNDPNNLVAGSDPVLDWSVGTASYFSIDGGLTQFDGRSLFSTGAYNGDGRQASHFKDTASNAGGCVGFNQIGIMDPTFCYGEMGVISKTDLAVFDAIGWNLNIDVLATKNYQMTTAYIFATNGTGVPEPATWGMMIGGLGLVGAAMRRRAATVSFA